MRGSALRQAWACTVASLLGAALLACAAPARTSAERMTSSDIESAESDNAAARRLIAQHDWAAADACLRRGLAALGDGYAADGTIDETGTRLVLADAKARAGDLPLAVTLRQRVLDNRIALAREKARLP